MFFSWEISSKGLHSSFLSPAQSANLCIAQFHFQWIRMWLVTYIFLFDKWECDCARIYSFSDELECDWWRIYSFFDEYYCDCWRIYSSSNESEYCRFPNVSLNLFWWICGIVINSSFPIHPFSFPPHNLPRMMSCFFQYPPVPRTSRENDIHLSKINLERTAAHPLLSAPPLTSLLLPIPSTSPFAPVSISPVLPSKSI